MILLRAWLMTRKPVWADSVEEAAFREKTCLRCFQPDEALRRITGQGPGCPHLARAAENKLPTPWTRRNATYGDTYRCEAQMKKPTVNRRRDTTVEDIEPLFNVDSIGCTESDAGRVCLCNDARECSNAYPVDYNLVPVDGWPDWRAEGRKTKEGDHQ